MCLCFSSIVLVLLSSKGPWKEIPLIFGGFIADQFHGTYSISVYPQGQRAVSEVNTFLAGWWLEHLLFFHILGRIIPTDFHIFRRDWNHQPVCELPSSTQQLIWWTSSKVCSSTQRMWCRRTTLGGLSDLGRSQSKWLVLSSFSGIVGSSRL